MVSRSYARLFAFAFATPLMLAMLAACADTQLVARSHNGQRIATVIQVPCSDDCLVVMTWDAKTGKQIVFYPDLALYAIAWSPDDTRFASTIEFSDVQIALVP